ncbi:MAG: hypothetical protein AB7F94_12390 [Nitrospira sp.]
MSCTRCSAVRLHRLQQSRNYPPGCCGQTHRTRVDTLEPYVERVLTALGHPEALVTDLSTIGDFGLDNDERSAASATVGGLCQTLTLFMRSLSAFAIRRKGKRKALNERPRRNLWSCRTVTDRGTTGTTKKE